MASKKSRKTAAGQSRSRKSATAASQTSRAVRQQHIAQLLETHSITKQAELVKLLAQQGIKTTQVTVSRDLEELGATKFLSEQGQQVYTLEELPKPMSRTAREHLQRVLKEWVHKVEKSGNLVVLRTAPGAAHVAASAIDRSQHPSVLATLGGDDTVLVVVREAAKPVQLCNEFAALAELS